MLPLGPINEKHPQPDFPSDCECKVTHINSITALFSVSYLLHSTNFYYFLPISTTQCFQTRKIPFTDVFLASMKGLLTLTSQP